MKVAFHFDANHQSLRNPYSPQIENAVFSLVIATRKMELHSKVYVGDLLLHVFTSGDESFQKAIKLWQMQACNGWQRFTKKMVGALSATDIFVVCFESITPGVAAKLHRSLLSVEFYLGAVEINDAAEIHWHLYSNALWLRYRIQGRVISLFYDELNGDESDTNEKEEAERMSSLGFEKVSFEPTNGKHSFFDRYHNFQQARRVAEWKTKFGEMLGFLVDEVACRLGDHIPELPNKLWAAVETFENAETDEQYAQVSATCRRILEFVADELFPPSAVPRGGRQLGRANYRNRLLAFMEDQTNSSTHVELIASSLELFAQHVEKLQNLANAGVHAEIQREGARRALLRTVFLLDDIVALRPDSFPIHPQLDFSMLERSHGTPED